VLVQVALVAVLTALSLGSYYSMASLPNVKLTDSVDFIATYVFGLEVGLSTTILTRTIYASFNPYGIAPITLIPILVVGDCFYPLSALLARRARVAEKIVGFTGRSLTLGMLGFFSALGFDVLTNFLGSLQLVSGPDPTTLVERALVFGLVTMNFPLPLGLLHELSDFLFFSTVVPVAILVINRSVIVQYSLLQSLTGRGRGKPRT